MSDVTRAELKTAYHWHCEHCSAENFALPAKTELTEYEREMAFRQHYEMSHWEALPDDWQLFELVWIPDEVTCEECGATFPTFHDLDNL